MTPEELDKAIRTNIPEDDFTKIITIKKVNQSIFIRLLRTLFDYTVIYNEYKELMGQRA